MNLMKILFSIFLLCFNFLLAQGSKYNAVFISDDRWNYTKIDSVLREFVEYESVYISVSIDSLPNSLRLQKKLSSLTLVSKTLGTLPEWISDLSDLRELRLYNMESLQEWSLKSAIASLPFLEELGIHNCKVDSVMNQIGKMSRLRILSLSHIDLSEFTKSFINNGSIETLRIEEPGLINNNEFFYTIGSFKKLQSLDLVETDFEIITFPGDGWKSLRFFQLCYNKKLTKLGDDIGKLEKVEIINLAVTGIKSLPDEIIRLQNLKTLLLKSSQIPENEVEKLRKMRSDITIVY